MGEKMVLHQVPHHKRLGVRVVYFILALVLSVTAWSDTLAELVRADNETAALALLITDPSDVNVSTSDGSTALHWAVHNDNAALVEKLITAGADVNAPNHYGATPLSEAAVVGNPRVIRALLSAGADVNATNPEGQTALMIVARSANVTAAELLLAAGADVNAREQWRGQSAVIWAAAQSQPEMVKLLLEHGANPNARTWVNRWERQISAERRHAWRPAGGFTALIYAARQGCSACVQHLLEAGADPDLADGEDGTALLIAILNLHFDTARLLIEAGANVNKWDMRGNQPLYAAVDMHTLPTGGYPDRPSVDGATALDIIDLLLARGANPNAQLKKGIEFRSIGDDRGADILLTTGATPLLRAAKAFDLPVVKRLLAHGALPNLPNLDGITPVMAAAGLGGSTVDTRGSYTFRGVQDKSIATLALLLAYGGDLALRDQLGRTAAHGAAFWGWNKVVKYLAERGADFTVVSREGISPFDAALGRMRMSPARGATGGSYPETADLIVQLTGKQFITTGEKG